MAKNLTFWKRPTNRRSIKKVDRANSHLDVHGPKRCLYFKLRNERRALKLSRYKNWIHEMSMWLHLTMHVHKAFHILWSTSLFKMTHLKGNTFVRYSVNTTRKQCIAKDNVEPLQIKASYYFFFNCLSRNLFLLKTSMAKESFMPSNLCILTVRAGQ